MVYEGETIYECLKKASNEIGKEMKDIKYKVIGMSENKGSMVIKIEVEFDYLAKKYIDLSSFCCDEIEIKISDNIELLVNNKIKKNNTIVNKTDEVFARILEETKKEVDLEVSKDKLQGILKIQQKGLKYLKLKKNIEDDKIILMVEEGDYKPLNLEDKKEAVLNIIKNKMVKFGLDFKKINEIISSRDEVVKGVIAKGIEAIDDEEDFIELIYDDKIDISDVNYRVDYKNINKIYNVHAGDELAKLHRGKVGKDGKDVFGNILKKRDKEGLTITLGEGTVLRDDIIYSTKEGRVKFEDNIITVVDIMEINGDVDVKSGDVNFIGDIKITGNVMMGMNVSGGNLININKNIESAIIKSSGDTIIKGNVLNSNVIAGLDNEDFLKYIDSIQSLIEDVEMVRNISNQLKEASTKKMPIGKLVKFVIDNKVITIQKKIFQVLAYKIAYKLILGNNNELIENLRGKLAGLGPLSIKDLGELDYIIKVLKNEVDKVRKIIGNASNVYIGYCQDSKITASGDIIFTNKGQYVSEIVAGRDVIFENENAVSRGGIVSANRNIKASIVGSPAGVTTLLNVMDKGKIEIGMFYHNTVVKIGNRRHVLNTKGKDLVAYLDKDGELIVEKTSI